jgi:hypothetical protein
MKLLDCPPGPRIGRALSYLATCIARDPVLNRPESLQELLLDWNRQQAD